MNTTLTEADRQASRSRESAGVERWTERIPYRDLLLNLVKAEIKVRYQGSWLGIMWSLLNPAAQIVLYIFVFSIVFRSGIDNYPLYLVSGLINHILFVQALSQGADSYVANGGLLGKINFPRILVPVATFVTNVYFWLMSVVVLAIAYPIIGGSVDWHLLLFLPVAGIYLVFVASMTIIAALLTVEFRDVKHLIEIVTMFLFWLTPIPYSLDMVPDFAAKLLFLNPQTWFMEAFHSVLYTAVSPSLSRWLGMLGWAAGSLLAALVLYRSRRGTLVEKL